VSGWGAELTAIPATAKPARAQVRLKVKPRGAARGHVDGAWWPRSRDPAMEFPGLVLATSSWVGPVTRVAYRANDWDEAGPVLMVESWPVRLAAVLTQEASTVVVTGSNQRGMTLLVVPPEMPGGAARALLGWAAGAGTVASVEEILATNGVQLGGSG
jgi:hypothetical protein